VIFSTVWQSAERRWALSGVHSCRKRRAGLAGGLLQETRETCRGTDGSRRAPEERSFSGKRSSGSCRTRFRRRARRSGGAGDAILAHNTLSAEDTRVRVFYPFHPLRNVVVQVVRRPKRGDGAVAVVDPGGKRLKIPVWMLSPEVAAVTITEQAYLSSESLLSLASLLATRLHAADQIRDNLLPTVVDGHKGGQRGATTTSGPGDRKGKRVRAHGRKGANRTDRSHGSHSGDSL
jgi:hypothetical protein